MMMLQFIACVCLMSANVIQGMTSPPPPGGNRIDGNRLMSLERNATDGGKRKNIAQQDDGSVIYESGDDMIKVAIYQLKELTAGGSEVCGSEGCFEFDPEMTPTNSSRTVMRGAGSMMRSKTDAADLQYGDHIRQMDGQEKPDFSGTESSLQLGDVTAKLQADLYEGRADYLFSSGETLSVETGDMKFTVIVQDYKFCGPEKMCMCNNGSVGANGDRVVLKVQMQAKAGGKMNTRPEQKSDNKYSVGDNQELKIVNDVIMVCGDGTEYSVTCDVSDFQDTDAAGNIVTGVMVTLMKPPCASPITFIWDPATGESGSATLTVSSFLLVVALMFNFIKL